MEARDRLVLKLAVFAAVFVAVAALVAAADGEHAATARHFLRNLLRQMF